jgi:hypothetical protein
VGQLTANSNACIHYRAPSISGGECRLGLLEAGVANPLASRLAFEPH